MMPRGRSHGSRDHELRTTESDSRQHIHGISHEQILIFAISAIRDLSMRGSAIQFPVSVVRWLSHASASRARCRAKRRGPSVMVILDIHDGQYRLGAAPQPPHERPDPLGIRTNVASAYPRHRPDVHLAPGASGPHADHHVILEPEPPGRRRRLDPAG